MSWTAADEYVTDPDLRGFKRFVSHVKDAIAYFGFKHLLLGRRGRRRSGGEERMAWEASSRPTAARR